MSTLVNVPKNRNLANSNSNQNFPMLTRLEDIINRELPSIFTADFNTGPTLPKVNISETTDAFTIKMAVPGFKKSDLNIDLDHRTLSISTETREDSQQSKAAYIYNEFEYSSFRRTFTLPECVNDKKIKATCNEGVLSILLPKKDEAKQKPPRRIKIS